MLKDKSGRVAGRDRRREREEEEKRGTKDRSARMAGIRNALLSFPTSGHSRATRVFLQPECVPRERVLLRLLSRCLTLPPYGAKSNEISAGTLESRVRDLPLGQPNGIKRKEEVPQDFSPLSREQINK